MLKGQGLGHDVPLVGLFWDAFAAADAIRDLSAIGFDDNQIGLLGILGRSSSDLRPFLSSLGLPAADAACCTAEFEDGALLLSIYLRPSQARKPAVEILRQYGGVFPSEMIREESVSHESQ